MREGRGKLQVGEGLRGPEGGVRLLGGESKGVLGVRWRGKGRAAQIVKRG
jgi:hypothetical protein